MLGRTNTGGGGGGGLNFKVICNPQPSTAKENTIWIDTDRINNTHFSATQPENMADYDVWISTGTSSTVAFSATKKNPIMVYPLSAKQYVGGAWVDKTAKIYQGGEWVDWSLYLFNNGNKCEPVTGGWRSVGAKSYYTAQAPSLTFSDGKMVVSQASGKSGLVSPAKLIDISKFSSLQIVVDSMSGTLDARFYKTLSPSDGDGENIGLAKLAVGTNDVPLPTTSPVCVALFVSSGVSGKIISVKLIP